MALSTLEERLNQSEYCQDTNRIKKKTRESLILLIWFVFRRFSLDGSLLGLDAVAFLKLMFVDFFFFDFFSLGRINEGILRALYRVWTSKTRYG